MNNEMKEKVIGMTELAAAFGELRSLHAYDNYFITVEGITPEGTRFKLTYNRDDEEKEEDPNA